MSKRRDGASSGMHMHNSELCVDFLQNVPVFEPFPEDDPEEEGELSPGENEAPVDPVRHERMLKERQRMINIRERGFQKKRLEDAKSAEKLETLWSELMAERETLLPTIRHIITTQNDFASKQREKMYHAWKTNEFDPIQESIKTKLKQLDPLEISKRKHELYSQYLEASNKNSGVFRDIIKEDQYDPLAGSKHAIKYKPSSALRARRKRAGKPKIRKMFDTTKWGENVVESTHIGRYSIQNKYNPSNFKKSDRFVKNTKSSVKFDHYNYQRGNSASKFGKRIDRSRVMPKKTKEMVVGFEHGERKDRRRAKKIFKKIKKKQ